MNSSDRLVSRINHAAVVLAAHSRRRVLAALRAISAGLSWVNRQVQFLARWTRIQVARFVSWSIQKFKLIVKWVWRAYRRIEGGILSFGVSAAIFVWAIRMVVGFIAVSILIGLGAGHLAAMAVGKMAGRALTLGIWALSVVILIFAPASSDTAGNLEQDAEAHAKLRAFLLPILKVLLRVAVALSAVLIWMGPQQATAYLTSFEWSKLKGISSQQLKPSPEPKPAREKPRGASQVAVRPHAEPVTASGAANVPTRRSPEPSLSRDPAPAEGTLENSPENSNSKKEADVSKFLDRARTLLSSGKCKEALLECEKGLAYFPAQPTLLDLKQRANASMELGFCSEK